MGKMQTLRNENSRLQGLVAKLKQEGVAQEAKIQRLEASNRALNAAIVTLESKIKGEGQDKK